MAKPWDLAPSDSSPPQDSLTTIPELKDYLRIFR